MNGPGVLYSPGERSRRNTAPIRPNTRLICMLHASNVMGSIMPIREAGKIAREHGVLFMVDAAQTAGVLPIDVEDDGLIYFVLPTCAYRSAGYRGFMSVKPPCRP